MGKVVYLNGYIRDQQLIEKVLPAFRKRNPAYQYIQSGNQAVFYHHHKDQYYYHFLTFVNKGDYTEFPGIDLYLQNVISHPHYSKNEWVVERTRHTTRDGSKNLLPLIYGKKEPNIVIETLKTCLR